MMECSHLDTYSEYQGCHAMEAILVSEMDNLQTKKHPTDYFSCDDRVSTSCRPLVGSPRSNKYHPSR